MLLIQELDDTKLNVIKKSIEGVLKVSKNGCEVSIKAYSKKRTNPQNEFLWAVYKRVAAFCEETGFKPDGLNIGFINSDFLHAYFKARFDLRTSTKLSTVEFMRFPEKIQDLMVEQTCGEYEPIYPKEHEYQQDWYERNDK